MKIKINLCRELFTLTPRHILKSDHFEVTAFCYPSGVEALSICNSRGNLIVLPWMGQMIWSAVFDGYNLTMESMFTQPKPASQVIATYGCFAFHSGLLANGCPGPQDTHQLHGEIPCAIMDDAWLELTGDALTIFGSYEYVMGFGHHYLAVPSVTMHKASSLFDIQMSVTNLASTPMPLQYMCHINYAYIPGAIFEQNIPDDAWELRESIPAHITPTPSWMEFNQMILSGEKAFNILNNPEHYDPEIVFFADRINQYTDSPEFTMTTPDGIVFMTKFNSAEMNYAARWVLYNSDQKVGSFVLPATCRPEGFIAAKNNGSLLYLKPQDTKKFKVTTGIL